MSYKAVTTYRVQATITVDRPELRDASYQRVEVGAKCPFSSSYTNYNRALAHFQSIVWGEYDFPSEYVSSVGVTATCGGKTYTVRTWRMRERFDEPVVQRHYSIARAVARRGESLGTANYLYMRNVQVQPVSL